MIVESTVFSPKQSLGGACDDFTTLERKDGCLHSSERLNGLSRFCFVFLHYTDAKICLSGQELNNDGLGHNKHMIKGRILLGCVLEGRDGRETGNLLF